MKIKFVILLSFFILSPLFSFDDLNQKISDMYFNEIEKASQNSLNNKDALISAGLEFNPSNPNLLFSLAESYRGEFQFQQELDLYNEAYKSISSLPFQDQQTLYLRLLSLNYRTKNYGQNVRLYSELEDTPFENKDILYWGILSFWREREEGKAYLLSQKGYSDTKDQKYLFFLAALGDQKDLDNLYNSILREGIHNKGVFLQSIYLTDKGSFQLEKLCRLYISFYHDAYSLYLDQYYLKNLDSPLGFDNNITFIDESPLFLNCLDFFNFTSYTYIKDLLQNKNELLIDSNFDLLSEWKVQKKDKRLSYLLDENQDGVLEGRIDYKNDKIESLFYKEGKNSYLIDFDRAESIKTIRLLVQNRLIRTFICKENGFSGLRKQFKTEESPFQIFNLLKANDFFNQSNLIEEALVIKDFVPNQKGQLFREYKIKNGIPWQIEEDSDLNGTLDHLLIIDNWKIIKGYRDYDENGTYDMLEFYRDDKLVEFNVLGDYSQYEEFLETSGDSFQMWDFSETLFYDGVLVHVTRSILN